MTQKERIESALNTAVSETKAAIRELTAAAVRQDAEAVTFWQKAATYWTDKINERIKQLKEVNAN